MALFKSRVGTSLRVGFLVKRNGALLTGQASNLTVEALSPTLGVSSGALTVTESTPKPGIYYVDVAAAFFAANGVGPYLLVAELAKPAPQPFDDVETFPLEITTRDLDDLAQPGDAMGLTTAAVDVVADGVWDEATAAHGAPGSFGEAIQDLDAAVSSILASLVLISTTAVTGSTATEIRTGRTEADGHWDDQQVVVFDDGGSGLAVARAVTAYAQTNGAFTVDTLPFTPAAGDRVLVIGRVSGGGGNSLAAIADAVWDELVADHLTASTYGAAFKRLTQLAEPDVVVDKNAKTFTLKDRTTGATLVTYNVTGDLDTRVEELDG